MRVEHESLTKGWNDLSLARAHTNCLYSLIERCCKDKWLSFLRKIVDRFPVEILSMQDRRGDTPYDCLINNYPYYHDEKWSEEVLDIFKPR